jgi:tRNA(fMet)-specific endonuclease VapC
MLDTNICIHLIKNDPPNVLSRLKRHDLGEIGVSSITAAELAYGAAKSGSERNRAALEQFLLPLDIAPFDDRAGWYYGDVRCAMCDVRCALEQAGTPIGPLDTQIAAHAPSLGCVLVTNNIRQFQRLSGLPVENWAR